MKRTLAAIAVSTVVAFLLVTGCVLKLDSQEDWVDLFDGETLNGWVQRGGQAKYSVVDGIIVGETVLNTPNSFMCTEKDYGNFILEVDFIVDGQLNSGIQIRSESRPDYKDGKVHGYQVEIDPASKPYNKTPKNLLADGSEAPAGEPRSWSGGIYDEGRRGWLNNLTKNEPARRAFKHGEWNRYRVEAIGDSIKTWVNGVPAADLTDDMTPKGFIAMQVHGSKTAGLKVKWRNIRIQVLD